MPGIVSYAVKATKINKAYFLQGAPSLEKKVAMLSLSWWHEQSTITKPTN